MGSPPWTDWHVIWGIEWRSRRNHPCQILCKSAKEFLGGSTPKSAISYTFSNDPYNSYALLCRLWSLKLCQCQSHQMHKSTSSSQLQPQNMANDALLVCCPLLVSDFIFWVSLSHLPVFRHVHKKTATFSTLFSETSGLNCTKFG